MKSQHHRKHERGAIPIIPLIVIAVAGGAIAKFLGMDGQVIATNTAASLIFIGGYFLGVVSWLFDYALVSLATNLDGNIFTTPGLQEGVASIWKVFRDISNILIIGMFTFIAIGVILGMSTFGGKKMIAKVLIVAVLINFSLLFTRIVVESSNFVAGKFYEAMKLNEGASGLAGSTGIEAVGKGSVQTTTRSFSLSGGLGGRFMTMLGVRHMFENDKMSDILNHMQTQNGGGVYGASLAVVFGFTTLILMAVTALVFGYAILLLVVRAVLILFLLATSAAAFGAYLIPQWGDKIWKWWWGALIRSAVFAPLLMLMLFMVLVMGGALLRGRGNASLADLFTKTTESGVQATLFFLIILAMLLAAIRIAHSFANNTPGFAYATAVTGSPLAIGDRVMGFLNRRFLIGAPAAAYSRRIGTRIGEANEAQAREIGALNPAAKNFDVQKRAIEKRYQERIGKLEGYKQRYDTIAGGKYQLSGTQAGNFLFNKVGNVPKMITGGKVEGYDKNAKAIAEDAAKRASEAVKLSDDAKNSLREEVAKQVASEQQHTTNKHQTAKNTADGSLESAKQARSTEEKRLEALQKERQALIEEQNRLGEGNTERHADIRKRIGATGRALDEQKERIRNAQKQINEAQNKVQEAKKTLDTHQDNLEKDVAKRFDTAIKSTGQVAQDLAASISQRWRVPDRQVADMARDAVKKRQSKSSKQQQTLREIFEGIEKENKAGDPT